MSITDNIIQDKPDKYETLINSRIKNKELQMELNKYNALQYQYDALLSKENNNRSQSTGGWSRIRGQLKQISAAGSEWLWGVNRDDAIYKCKKPCADSNWIRVVRGPGGLEQIEGGDKEVWGVTSSSYNNRIYKMNQDGTGGWTQVPGKLTNISQGGGWVWGVNSSNNVYRCKQPCDGNWILDTTPTTKEPTIDFKYLGNWRDGGDRRLPVYKGMTYSQAGCNQACKDYSYFSLQWGNGHSGQCFCGNDLRRAKSYGNCGGNKVTGGGWCNSLYEVNDDKIIKIYVGNSRTNTKTVNLPHDDMIVSPLPINQQNKRWGDQFSVKVNGNKLTVKRSDSNYYGWGQKLVLEGMRKPENRDKMGPSMVQLSCNNTYVYGIDTNKRAWRKNINGSGKWTRFGNPTGWQFYWINASNPSKILAVSMGRKIYSTDIDGRQTWSLENQQASGVSTVSGQDENNNYYITNTNDHIYRHEPIVNGGYWLDLQNENYQIGMVSGPTKSTDDWKYLGKTNKLEDCKLKAVEDDANAYSSVVYYPSDFGNDWNNSCFGGVKGKNINSEYQKKTITALAPNGTTRLGGDEGENILKEMKKIQKKIKVYVKELKKSDIGLEKTKDLFHDQTNEQTNELNHLLEKLKTDREEINKILQEPDEDAFEEDSRSKQIENYTTYGLWLLLSIVSICIVIYLYVKQDSEIPMGIYVFIAIWVLLFIRKYYTTVINYGESLWKYIASLPIPMPNV